MSRGVNLKKTPKILIIRIHFRFRFESLSIFLKRKHKKSYLPDFSTRSVDYWIFRNLVLKAAAASSGSRTRSQI